MERQSPLFSAVHVCLAGLAAFGDSHMCPPTMFHESKGLIDSHYYTPALHGFWDINLSPHTYGANTKHVPIS